MGIRNIFLIIDPNKFNKEDIVNIIKSEGWEHNFYFPSMSEHSDNKLQIRNADEIWLMGEVSSQRDYKIAIELNCDLWQMA
jgi:hypothetical protein